MLEGLQNEINNHPDLVTASKEIVMQKLNADGSAMVETNDVIPVSENPIRLSKAFLLTTYLDKSQRTALRNMLTSAEQPEAGEDLQDFATIYHSDDVFFVNHPTFRSMIDDLATPLLLSTDIVTAIKRLGERKISRAEELFGRKITAEDFE